MVAFVSRSSSGSGFGGRCFGGRSLRGASAPLLGQCSQNPRGARDRRHEKTGQLGEQHFLAGNGGQGLHTFGVELLAVVHVCLSHRAVWRWRTAWHSTIQRPSEIGTSILIQRDRHLRWPFV